MSQHTSSGRRDLESDLSFEVREAVAREDVLGVVLALMEIELDFGAGVVEWSEPFCRGMVQHFGGGDHQVCLRDESISGGEYGQRLHAALLRFVTEIEPRIAVPPVLGEEDVFSWLSAVQPDVERVFAEIREQVEALDPPDQLEMDHALIVTYLDELSDVARRITEATEERDAGALNRLFNESGRPEENLLRVGLSDAARPIVGMYFEG